MPDRANKPINAMIAGIPNVGKSTIINFLAGKKIAKTGNTPAVTKQQQRVHIGDGFTLVDTPGVMWPNVHNENSGYRLALIGTIKETAMDYAEVGFFGVIVNTRVQTPRLNGRLSFTFLVFKVFNVNPIAGDLLFFVTLILGFLILLKIEGIG